MASPIELRLVPDLAIDVICGFAANPIFPIHLSTPGDTIAGFTQIG